MQPLLRNVHRVDVEIEMNYVAPTSKTDGARLGQNPTLGRRISYFVRGEKHLFLEPEGPDWIIVNSNGAYVLGLCDGTRSTLEIKEHIVGLGGNSEAVVEVLSYAMEHGIIERDIEEPFGCCSSSGCATSHLRPLRNIYVQMTNACNLNCTYCYASSGKSHGTLTVDELIGLFRNAKDMSPNVSFVLTGGEPLLNSFTIDYASEIKRQGNSVYLTSNGTPITQKNVESIAKIFDRIRISIDGLDESIHAITRGRGNHPRVVEAIELLQQAGANVEVAMVVTRVNVSQIPSMVERYGKSLRFQPLLMSGRQREHDAVGLSPEDYYDAIKPFSADLIVNHVNFMRRRGNNRCSAAEAGLSIAENGDAYPCQIFHYPAFRGGNIRENSLWEILQSDAFRRVRSLSVDSLRVCSTCAIRKICGGSCRAYAYSETGEDDRPDSSCNFQKLAIADALFASSELDQLANPTFDARV